MDGARFDRWARSLAGRASRRSVVGGLLGLGAGLVGVATGDAACPEGRVRSRERCLCKLTGRPAAGGICPCPAGQIDHGDGWGCQADCALVEAGTQCGVGRVCSGGACVGNGVCTAPGAVDFCGQPSCARIFFFTGCAENTERAAVCAGNVLCSRAQPCDHSSECPAGETCGIGVNCQVCLPICTRTATEETRVAVAEACDADGFFSNACE